MPQTPLLGSASELLARFHLGSTLSYVEFPGESGHIFLSVALALVLPSGRGIRMGGAVICFAEERKGLNRPSLQP